MKTVRCYRKYGELKKKYPLVTMIYLWILWDS